MAPALLSILVAASLVAAAAAAQDGTAAANMTSQIAAKPKPTAAAHSTLLVATTPEDTTGTSPGSGDPAYDSSPDPDSPTPSPITADTPPPSVDATHGYGGRHNWASQRYSSYNQNSYKGRNYHEPCHECSCHKCTCCDCKCEPCTLTWHTNTQEIESLLPGMSIEFQGDCPTGKELVSCFCDTANRSNQVGVVGWRPLAVPPVLPVPPASPTGCLCTFINLGGDEVTNEAMRVWITCK